MQTRDGLSDDIASHFTDRRLDYDEPRPFPMPQRILATIAAWLIPYSLDMAWDLTQDRYEEEGYILRYLVNSSATSQGESNILDATTLADEEIKALTVNGYEYGVLIRVK